MKKIKLLVSLLLVTVIFVSPIYAAERKCDPTKLELVSIECPELLYGRTGQPEKNYLCHLIVRASEDLNLSDYTIHI
ncbi:MAG: hypothetical protein KAU03_04635, partial [Candidatus Altiarchaeales archaeon]|nr:hypothetical protein [Candidatus Altiarchaeales archaeon]